MKISSYNEKENIIKIKADGKITAKEFVRVYQNIKNSDEYRKDYRLKIMIYHTKQSQYSDEILKNKSIYQKAISNLLEIYPSIIKADVVENPLDTAKQMVLDDDINNPNFKTNLFYTKEAAKKWIKNPTISGFSGFGKTDEQR